MPTEDMMKPKHPIINGEKILKQYEKAILSVTCQFTSAGGQNATVYTRDKAVIRKFDSLVAAYPDIYRQGRRKYPKHIPCRNHTLVIVNRES